MFKKLGLIVVCSVFVTSFAIASPVNLPTGIKGQDGLGLTSNLPVGISAGYIFDYVGKRELSKDSGSADFYMNGGKIDFTILNNFDIYTVLGGIQNPEFKESAPGDVNSITVNGTTYSKSQFGSAVSASADWQEWQVALGVSKKFQYFVPYGGVVYSDVKTSAKATVSGTTYDSGSVSSRYKVGPFVGVSILPTKWLSIDVTGRFVAEEAVSVSATVKF